MSAPTFGKPDWLQSVEGAAKALFSDNIASVGSTFVLPLQYVQSFKSILVSLDPIQDVSIGVGFFDTFSSGVEITSLGYTIAANKVGVFNIPVVGTTMNVLVSTISGAQLTGGLLVVSGHNSGGGFAVGRGVQELKSNVNLTAGAGATVTETFDNVAEGPASFYIRSTATTWSVTIEQLQADGTWKEIAQVTNTDPSPSRFEQWMEGKQGRVKFINNDGVLRAINYAVVMGG